MKHLRKFENFLPDSMETDEQDFINYSKGMRNAQQEEEYIGDDDVMPEDLYGSEEEEGDFDPMDNYDSREEEEGDFDFGDDDDDFDDDFDNDFEDEFGDEYSSNGVTQLSDFDPVVGEGEEEEEDDDFEGGHIMRFEAKKNSYKKKKGKPDFLDIDKDGDKKETMKKAAKDKKGGGLSAAQKKLPEALRKAIEKRKK